MPCALSRSSAVDSRSGLRVAIKKLYRPFQSELYAKRAYRELRLLKHMRHDNVRRGPRVQAVGVPPLAPARGSEGPGPAARPDPASKPQGGGPLCLGAPCPVSCSRPL